MSIKPRSFLAIAIGLAMGAFKADKAKDAEASVNLGHAMLARIKYHHKGLVGHRTSGVAASKRLQKKRREVRKHPRAAHKQGGHRWNRVK